MDNIKLRERSVELITSVDAFKALMQIHLANIETAARLCYAAKCSTDNSIRDKFIRGLIARGHESVIEHGNISFIVNTDRASANQLVRHRLASYTQASLRYIDYTKESNGGLSFVLDKKQKTDDVITMLKQISNTYKQLITTGMAPENARVILPMCTYTKIFVTMNFREIRNFLKLRLDTHAQTGIRIMAVQIYNLINSVKVSAADDYVNPILTDLKKLYDKAVVSLSDEFYL